MPAVLNRLVLVGCLALLAACGGSSERATRPTPGVPTTGPATASSAPSSPSASAADVQTIAVTVAGGRVTPKPGRVKVPLGKSVVLRVTSDVADEVHVHGYDVKRDLAAGGTASVEFTADVPGIFEVELESKGLRLLELQVS